MICPKCGHENPESAGMCSSCRYKFKFGHAFNDPAQMTMSRFKQKNTGIRIPKWIFYGVFLLIVIVIVLAILLSLKQA